MGATLCFPKVCCIYHPLKAVFRVNSLSLPAVESAACPLSHPSFSWTSWLEAQPSDGCLCHSHRTLPGKSRSCRSLESIFLRDMHCVDTCMQGITMTPVNAVLNPKTQPCRSHITPGPTSTALRLHFDRTFVFHTIASERPNVGWLALHDRRSMPHA